LSPPIKLTEKLPLLANTIEYPDRGVVLNRWGQLLRTTPQAEMLLTGAYKTGRFVTLGSLARIRSGVVTRANAYFIVQELPFEQIPNRFHVTRRDHSTVAVILDGKDSPHRIGRRHLREIVKGPESLIGPIEVQKSDLRLVAIEESPEELKKSRDNDTKAYIRRGETVDYNISADKMKGGIPAQRANIKSRTPYWYCLNVPPASAGRLVIPEHIDQRFIATALVGSFKNHVVIDTCYVVECNDPSHQLLLLAALNSLLSWYQIELRGRTQHGEGVLKVKIPDFKGVMVLDPSTLPENELAAFTAAFDPLLRRKTLIVQEELGQEDRTYFENTYLRLAGIPKKRIDEMRSLITRELREAMAERRTRPESVAELKAQRAPRQRTSRVIDAFAARIISSIPAYPDPRHSVPNACSTIPVSISAFEGTLTVGSGLFDSGIVFAGVEKIAVTNSPYEARFVRVVLAIDPELRTVEVPTSNLAEILKQWWQDVTVWWDEFSAAFTLNTEQITDPTIVEAVKSKALELVHACEIPRSRFHAKTYSSSKLKRPSN
jgi:hypothetical protein